MKKLSVIFLSLIYLLLVSNVYSNPYDQSYYPEQYNYANYSCVGQCEEPCVGQFDSCGGGRFYVGAFGGANWLNFHRTHGISPKFETGFATALSLGYKFHNGFRVEGEVAYRRNQLKKKHWFRDDSYGEYSENNKVTISGSTHSWSGMANLLYDFDCVSSYLPQVVPYVGFGLGYTHVSAHIKGHENGKHECIKGSANGLAGQAIAGVSYRLTDSTSLGLEYRYFIAREHARDHSLGLALRQAF
jgi:opacity protein-like surface antigen